jgi:hypothetical protein
MCKLTMGKIALFFKMRIIDLERITISMLLQKKTRNTKSF